MLQTLDAAQERAGTVDNVVDNDAVEADDVADEERLLAGIDPRHHGKGDVFVLGEVQQHLIAEILGPRHAVGIRRHHTHCRVVCLFVAVRQTLPMTTGQ